MAFPKKHTRQISVDNRSYVWHLNQNSLVFREAHITIAENGVSGQILYLDPYPWGLEIRPKKVRKAILWAIENGWTPAKKGPPMYLGFQNGEFFILPGEAKFTHEIEPEVSE
ncbi:MAG: hypothetical protein AAF351_11385 [Pseudomonadota bacterium]